MSAFYVSQRVRKARGTTAIGTEGTVMEVNRAGDPDWSMYVRLDTPAPRVHILDMTPAGVGREGWTNPDLWEPITPDGLESIEEINALYEPSPEVVRA